MWSPSEHSTLLQNWVQDHCMDLARARRPRSERLVLAGLERPVVPTV